MCVCMYIYRERDIHTCVYVCTYIHIYIYIYSCVCIYIYIYTHMFGFAGGAECLYELLVVFGPQLLLDMWLPRSIGCSRGCGMSSCNHACESLLAWIFWCGFLRRGFFRREFWPKHFLDVNCLGMHFGVDFFPHHETAKPLRTFVRKTIPVLFTPKSALCNHAAMWPCCSVALPLLQLSLFTHV